MFNRVSSSDQYSINKRLVVVEKLMSPEIIYRLAASVKENKRKEAVVKESWITRGWNSLTIDRFIFFFFDTSSPPGGHFYLLAHALSHDWWSFSFPIVWESERERIEVFDNEWKDEACDSRTLILFFWNRMPIFRNTHYPTNISLLHFP